MLNAVQPDRSQIVSTVKTDMKVSTLNREAIRGYKFPELTQNLVSFPVLSYHGWNITLDRTIIKVTKSGNQAMKECREHQTRLWRLKLEDAQKEECKRNLCICNNSNDQNINSASSESNIKEMLELLTRELFIPVKSTLLRAAKNGNFATWKSIMENNITKFLAKSESAALGHTYQAHNNTRSTWTMSHTDSG